MPTSSGTTTSNTIWKDVSSTSKNEKKKRKRTRRSDQDAPPGTPEPMPGALAPVIAPQLLITRPAPSSLMGSSEPTTVTLPSAAVTWLARTIFVGSLGLVIALIYAIVT